MTSQQAMTSKQATPPHISPDDLQAYLHGWADEPTSQSIEAHLAGCEVCEETLVALESDGNTLVEQVRRAGVVATAKPTLRSRLDPPATLGGYQIIRLIGSGGMGAVYLGKHTQLNKTVAIKLVSLPSHADGSSSTRFAREIRAAGGLNHPAIVTATDAGQHDQFHFLVMEYIDGQDVSQIARAVGPLKISDACEIARVAAEALAYAHGEGIVHRDIKPSNLMIDRSGSVKLLDFGLAQNSSWDEATAELTTVGQLMGTLDYMAPEQAEHPETVDHRADLYSLGATLFRLLCGRAPLSATPNLSPLAKLRLLANHHPPRADSLRKELPKPLSDLVAALLASDPNDRPASALHAAEMLQPFCVGHDLGTLATVKASQPPAEIHTFAAANEDNDVPPRQRWWIATAALPLLALAGILFTLETQKGHLVIESEAAVSIVLSKDGKVHDKVSVQPGTTTTKLYAGEYEITLADGSDGFTIDKDVIELTKGDTSVARVSVSQVGRQQGVLDAVPADVGNATVHLDSSQIMSRLDQRLGNLDSKLNILLGKGSGELSSDARNQLKKQLKEELSDATADRDALVASLGRGHPRVVVKETHLDLLQRKLLANDSTDITYDGQTLDYWLATVKTERSPKLIHESLNAIETLTRDSSSFTVSKALLAQGPKIAVTDSKMGAQLVSIVQSTLKPDEFVPLMVRELRTSDNDLWKQALLSRADALVRNKNAEVETVAPLLNWVDANVLAGHANDTIQGESLRLYLSLAALDWDGQQRIINALIASKRISDSFWMATYSPDLPLQMRVHRVERMKALAKTIGIGDTLFQQWLGTVHKSQRDEDSLVLLWLRDDPSMRIRLSTFVDELKTDQLSPKFINQYSTKRLDQFRRTLAELLRVIDDPAAIGVDAQLMAYAERQARRYDKDNDLRLSSEEIEAMPMFVKPKNADLDGDGLVSVGEYAKSLADRRQP